MKFHCSSKQSKALYSKQLYIFPYQEELSIKSLVIFLLMKSSSPCKIQDTTRCNANVKITTIPPTTLSRVPKIHDEV